MVNQTTQNGAPISDDIVANVADEEEIDADIVRQIIDSAQNKIKNHIDEYRDGSQVVAETEDIIIVLIDRGYSVEASQTTEDLNPQLADPVTQDKVYSILSKSHEDAFRSQYRHLTGYSKQAAVAATGNASPIIIAKPNNNKLTANGETIKYQIQYDNKNVGSNKYLAEATLAGEYGTLNIERTYTLAGDEISVTSNNRHVESNTCVKDVAETHQLDDILPHKSNIDTFDFEFLFWIYQHHTDSIADEYADVQASIDICQKCDSYTNIENGVIVDQRPTNELDISDDTLLCNHCYSQLLAEATKLSTQEADVYALIDSELTHREVAEALGEMSRSQVGTVMGRIKDKRENAEKEVEKIKRTVELLN